MSLPNNIPTIIVGNGNWGIKQGNLLGYSQSDYKLLPREFAVTRGGGTNGTFVGSNGLIQTAASGNLPRIDFYGGSPALLVEPQAQNIMAQSETLSVSGNWTQADVLVTGSAITSPDGLASGTLIVATTASGAQHYIFRNANAIASGQVYTFSCFLKAHGTNTFAQITIGAMNFLPANPFANFQLTGSGSVTAGNGTRDIQSYGNGWYRCSITLTAAGNAVPSCFIVPILSGTTGRLAPFTGDGVNGVYAWGFQVELGSVATSYIPTTTGSVTRNADVINLTGATDYIGQAEGTLYAEVDIRAISQARVLLNVVDSVDGFASRIRLGITSGNVLYGLVSTATKNANTATTGIYKIALAYDSNGFIVYVNGTSYGTDATTTGGTKSVVTIGSNPTGADYTNDRIRTAAIYNKRLPNDQLQALTTL